MPPRFLILSRDRATAYEPRRAEVCISIVSPNDLPVRLSPKFNAVLRLTFSDIVNNSRVRRPWDVPFAPEHAAEIVSFVSRWRNVDQFVVHCTAGLSRSPGVALGICDLQGWARTELERKHPMWNTWVRDELVRIGRTIAWPIGTGTMASPDPARALADPSRVWARCEVLSRPCPVPAARGLYGWFVRDVPVGVPTHKATTHHGLTLLYVGTAPSRPSSSTTLRNRIRQHYRGDASRSTLRLTLGCLLAEQLGIELSPTGPAGRLTFGAGEKVLSEWMAENAFVTWVDDPQPWAREPDVIALLRPPLNLGANRGQPFYDTLSGIRRRAKAAR